MKKTLLLTNHYEGVPLDILKKAVGEKFHLMVLKEARQEELVLMAPEADYFLASGRLKIDETVIRRASKLRMIQRTGVGLDTLDLTCLKEKGIPLYVNRGVNAVSVAEHTVMLMLSSIKRSYAVNRQMREGVWKKQQTGLTTHELAGKTIGLVGMGSIGRAVAGMLAGFQVDICYYDMVPLPHEEEDRLHVRYAEFEDLVSGSDIISLHCGYDPASGYLIAEKEFASMKEGAVLINTARGKLVKETALIEALESGRLAACGIDTFEQEPPGQGSPLGAYEQALLSPHIAGVSYEAFYRMMSQAVENICLFDQGSLEQIRDRKIV